MLEQHKAAELKRFHGWLELNTCNRNRNRNLKTSKALLESQAHQGNSLFTSAATNQRVVTKGGVKRSSGPISRIPGGDRVAVKAGVVQVEKGTDLLGQGRSV